jgi:putative membrane protein
MRNDVRMLRWFLVRWAFNVAALWVAALLLSGVYFTGSDQWLTLILAGLVFSVVSFAVKPLLALLTLPLIIFTLGLAYFLIALLMVLLTSWIVSSFHVDGFWAAAGATVIVWAVNTVLEVIARRVERA